MYLDGVCNATLSRMKEDFYSNHPLFSPLQEDELEEGNFRRAPLKDFHEE